MCIKSLGTAFCWKWTYQTVPRATTTTTTTTTIELIGHAAIDLICDAAIELICHAAIELICYAAIELICSAAIIIIIKKRLAMQGWEREIATLSVRRPQPHTTNL